MEDFTKMQLSEAELKDLIFDLMIGAIDLDRFPFPAGKIVENEYEPGKECEKLYGEVYEANRRICERLGVDEDDDVTTILNCMDNIARILAYKMFDYGVRKDVFYR